MKIKDLPKIESRGKDGKIRGGKINQLRTFGDYLKKREQRRQCRGAFKKILAKFSGNGLAKASIEELKNTFGLGKAKACEIMACFELGKGFCKTKSLALFFHPKKSGKN